MSFNKNGLLKTVVASAFLAVCLSLLMIARAGFGQQPQNRLESPLENPIAASSEEYKNDPLFQEIQRLLLKEVKPNDFEGTETPNPPLQRPHTPNIEVEIDSISDARWHAIETILSASRSLEKSRNACAQQNDLVGAAKTQTAIRLFRTQAADLLLSK